MQTTVLEFKMRIIQLCMMTLALCTQANGEDFIWQGCGAFGLPTNSEIGCNSQTGCSIICLKGHEFSNGASYLDVVCQHGLWTYLGSTTIPQCKSLTLVCTPSCQNGGICESTGVCRCLKGFSGVACGFHSCDIKSVFDGGYRCYYRNSQYTCDILCSKGEEEVSHTCSHATGIWSPPINKCKPANSKCVIEPAGFDWRYSCSPRNIGYSCDLWCTNEEDAVTSTHICDHSTGIWSPPLTKCIPDLSKCKSATAGYDGGYTCHYRNSLYICDLFCIKGEDTIRHVCSPSTGVWSPPIAKCKPDNSKCDIRAVFNGGSSCSYSNIGYKCYIYCSNKEDVVTHICSHNTGFWSPPITKCQKSKEFIWNGKPKEFNWNGCTKKGLPEGSRISCSSATGCEVTCIKGYQFSNGAEHIKLECYLGHWTYIGNRAENSLGPPRCQPVCSPSCRNGGECLRPGLCRCTADFTGPLCQYRLSNCDIEESKLNNRYRCSGNSKQFICSLWCIDEKYAVTHTCTYSTGRWSPPIRKCIL